MRAFALALALAACEPVESIEPIATATTPNSSPRDRPSPAPTPDEAPTHTVLTLNLRWDDPAAVGAEAWVHRRPGALALLHRVDADLIGTQEAMASQVADLNAALTNHTLVSVATKLEPEQHDSMLFFRTARYALLGTHHFWLSSTPDTPRSDDFPRAEPSRGDGPRSVSCAELADRNDGGRALVFCNTHFDGDRLVNEASARLLRARIEARYAKSAIIITGDFNALPFTEQTWDEAPPWAAGMRTTTYATLTDQLHDVQAELHSKRPARLRCPGQECSFANAVRIDWILASHHFDPRAAKALSRYDDDLAFSDHWPIVAEVTRRMSKERAPTSHLVTRRR